METCVSCLTALTKCCTFWLKCHSCNLDFLLLVVVRFSYNVVKFKSLINVRKGPTLPSLKPINQSLTIKFLLYKYWNTSLTCTSDLIYRSKMSKIGIVSVLWLARRLFQCQLVKNGLLIAEFLRSLMVYIVTAYLRI